jgi:NADH-quinone oxidoreductase subunit N
MGKFETLTNSSRSSVANFGDISSFVDSGYIRACRLRRVRYGVSIPSSIYIPSSHRPHNVPIKGKEDLYDKGKRYSIADQVNKKNDRVNSASGINVEDVNLSEDVPVYGSTNIRVDRSQPRYALCLLRCVITVARRRTKLDGVSSNERTRRRSGKRIQTYSTEWIKVIRRSTTFACRRASSTYTGQGTISAYEYPILIMLSTLSLMRLVNANDRIGIYIAIEWLSLGLYVRAAFRRGSAYSTEAGLKYYVVGSFGSAWMLLGIALVYGWRGSRNRIEIERRILLGFSGESFSLLSLESNTNSDGVGPQHNRYTEISMRSIWGWTLIRASFLLKLAGVPLHRWLADVYEGGPTPSILYFSVVPKAGLFRITVRVVSLWYTNYTSYITSDRFVTKRRIGVAVRSIGVGAIGALTQRRRKRFRAYSAIGHTGYMLLGVRTGTAEGVQSLRIYLMVYRVITLIIWQRRRSLKVYESKPSGIHIRDVKYRTDLTQLGKRNPSISRRIRRTCMSLAGVPPMAGFGAKIAVFNALISSSYPRLAARSVRFSVIGAFNYIRIVKRMFFEDPSHRNLQLTDLRMTRFIARRRAAEGRWRTRFRIHPSPILLLTHRISLQLVSR